MDMARLRDLLRPNIIALKDASTHEMLLIICNNLGLPTPPSEGSKREKITTSFEALSDADLPVLAERLLKLHPPSPSTRNEIQDFLWADIFGPEIPKKFRRELARTLSINDLYMNSQRFDDLLDRLWILDDDPLDFFGSTVRSLRKAIKQHVHHNPGDWSAEELFDKLGAFDASNRRFCLFLEGIASPDVLPDEAAQHRFVQIVNRSLQGCGVSMRESDIKDGYPIFTVVSTLSAPVGRPKNLIFASSIKPDIRFRDAVNNEIEIVTNADKVLVYDLPIGSDGLRWRDLQLWWRGMNGIANDDEAKKTLYRRLKDSLPKESPAQIRFFNAFHHGFKTAIPDLPALLPEVWLHWDPKTVRERGPDALLRFRMDFLMLLPAGARVVLEIDGKHHYSRENGLADCNRYADMVAADRELRLAGYDVFRFGTEELNNETAQNVVKDFFDRLFKRYGVIVP